MEMKSALRCFAALSQETRLETVRLLVRAGEAGLPAGEIARQIGVSNNLMSAHLAKLDQADLVASQRHGRSIIYRANYMALRGVIEFLMADCCSGMPAIIGDLAFPLSTDGAER